MSSNRPRLLTAVVVAALLASACGGSGSDDAAADATEETPEVTETTATEPAAEPDEPEVDEPEAPVIEAREIGETVRYGGFEIEVRELLVDDEGVDDPSMAVPLGLTFELSLENTEDTNATPTVNAALQWDDEGDDIVEISGAADVREVPGGSSSRGSIEFQIMPADLETWDEDTARLVFGRSGEATAIIPLGDDAGDLVTRLPVPQDLDEELDLGGFVVEIEDAIVRWDLPGSRQQVDDGTAILEITAQVVNTTDGQLCVGSQSSRITPTITLVDGTSRTLLDTNLNCLAGDETERDAKFAFDIDDPFVGEYTIELEGGRIDGVAAITFELTDDDGTDDDEDEDEDEGRTEDDEDDE